MGWRAGRERADARRGDGRGFGGACVLERPCSWKLACSAPVLGSWRRRGARRPASRRPHAARIASRRGTRPFARKRDPARREGRPAGAKSQHVQMFHVKHSPALLARRVIERATASRARLRCESGPLAASCLSDRERFPRSPSAALPRSAPRCRKTATCGRILHGNGAGRTGESERMFHVKHRSPLFVVLGRRTPSGAGTLRAPYRPAARPLSMPLIISLRGRHAIATRGARGHAMIASTTTRRSDSP